MSKVCQQFIRVFRKATYNKFVRVKDAMEMTIGKYQILSSCGGVCEREREPWSCEMWELSLDNLHRPEPICTGA